LHRSGDLRQSVFVKEIKEGINTYVELFENYGTELKD